MDTDSLVLGNSIRGLHFGHSMGGVNGTGKSLVLYKDGLIDFEEGASDKR